MIRVELEKDGLGGDVAYPLFGYEEITFNKACINVRILRFFIVYFFIIFQPVFSLYFSLNF